MSIQPITARSGRIDDLLAIWKSAPSSFQIGAVMLGFGLLGAFAQACDALRRQP